MDCSKLEAMAIYVENQACGNDIGNASNIVSSLSQYTKVVKVIKTAW
jgi:hypothetical protein